MRKKKDPWRFLVPRGLSVWKTRERAINGTDAARDSKCCVIDTWTGEIVYEYGRRYSTGRPK